MLSMLILSKVQIFDMNQELVKNSSKRSKREKKIIDQIFPLCKYFLYEVYNGNCNIYKIEKDLKTADKKEIGTGSTRKADLIDARDNLEKAGLIKAIKRGVGRPGKRFELTSFGNEVARLVVDANRYNQAYFNFVQALRNKILLIEPKYLEIFANLYPNFDAENKNIKRYCQHKLRNSGWQDNEIEFYGEYLTNTIDFKNVCHNNFIRILEIRYTSIFRKNIEKLNKYAKSMIKNFIFSLIDDKVSCNLVDNFNEEAYGYPSMRTHTGTDRQNVTYSGKTNGTVELFADIEKIFVKHPVPSVIVDEIKDMLMSYFDLLEFPLEQLDCRIGRLLEYANSSSSRLTENDTTPAANQEDEEAKYLGELFVEGYAMTSAEKRFQNLVIQSVKLYIDIIKEYADKMGYGSDLFMVTDKPAPSIHIFQSN